MAVTALPPSDRLARFLAAETGASQVCIAGLALMRGGAIQENWAVDAEFAGGRLAGGSAWFCGATR